MSILDLNNLPTQLRRHRVLVLGDVMLDETVFGQIQRISPEAPIPVLQEENIQQQCGGAANAAMTLSSLRIPTLLVGVVGADAEAQAIRDILVQHPDAANISAELYSDPSRPTTRKRRFRVQAQQVFRADREITTAIGDDTAIALLEKVTQALDDCRALVISDYAKGTLTPQVLKGAIAAARQHGVPSIIDPAPSHLAHYRGADYLTPNRNELRAMIGDYALTDPDLGNALRRACREHGLGGLLLTRSEEGMSLFMPDSDGGQHHYLPAMAQEVFDVTGAGDTVVAVFSAGLAAGYPAHTAAALATNAAAVVVNKVGTASLTMHELCHQLASQTSENHLGRAAIFPDDTLQHQVALWHKEGSRIGFTNGCFDLLHPGHVALLHFCSRHCDRLIVGLNSDASVRRLKGEGRPVQTAETRAAMLLALPEVDAVVSFDEDTPLALIETIQPNCLIKGGDYRPEQVVGADIVTSCGGRVLIAPFKDGYATSRTLARIRHHPP